MVPIDPNIYKTSAALTLIVNHFPSPPLSQTTALAAPLPFPLPHRWRHSPFPHRRGRSFSPSPSSLVGMARVSECSTLCSDGKGTTAATTILPLPLSPSASMAGLRAYGAETSAMAIHLSFSPLSPSKRRASEGGTPEGGGASAGWDVPSVAMPSGRGHDRSAVGGDGDELGTTGFDGKLAHLLALRPCHVGEGTVLDSMWARDQRQLRLTVRAVTAVIGLTAGYGNINTTVTSLNSNKFKK
uniref:Uncharacterized protein n=1 Tax=Oryza barthii TaxID=65489 RepID=A0A0D3EVN1_9ORYZ